jgi:Tfp pilus assembly protein PilX
LLIDIRPMKKLNSQKGVLLIICLLLLIVLAATGLTVLNVSVTNNKANNYLTASVEAQQKADSIADYVFNYLASQNETLADLVTCAPSKNCLIWNSQPVIPGGNSMTDAKSNTTIKQWWYANAHTVPSTTQLHAFPTGTTYADINGSQVTDPISGYAIIQDKAVTYGARMFDVYTNSKQFPSKALRIIAYSTDKSGQVAAIKQVYYPWVAKCYTDGGVSWKRDNTTNWMCYPQATNNYMCVCMNGSCNAYGYQHGYYYDIVYNITEAGLSNFLSPSYKDLLLQQVNPGVDSVTGWNCTAVDYANFTCTCSGCSGGSGCGGYCSNVAISGTLGQVYNNVQANQLGQFLSLNTIKNKVYWNSSNGYCWSGSPRMLHFGGP